MPGPTNQGGVEERFADNRASCPLYRVEPIAVDLSSQGAIQDEAALIGELLMLRDYGGNSSACRVFTASRDLGLHADHARQSRWQSARAGPQVLTLGLHFTPRSKQIFMY